MNILIVGCGRTGLSLALKLDDLGYDVAVVDKNQFNLDMLGNDFGGITVCGEPIDVDVLQNADCANADFVAVVTHDDNMNIMASQLIKTHFGVSRVYTRIFDPSLEDIFSEMGLSTICPTRFVNNTLFSIITEIEK